MIQIPDDPFIRCMEATGLPPWWDLQDEEDDDDE